jgi:hypothetical protein
MSMISANYTRLIAASEASYGTDAVNAILTTASADIIYQEVADPAITPEITVVEINRSRGAAAGNAHGVIKNKCTVSARIPLLGRDTGKTYPYYAPFLKAMNLAESVDNGDGVYVPATVQQAGMSAYLYHYNLEDAKQRLQVATGVRGSGSLELALDAEAFITFEGVGQYAELTDDVAFFNATTGAAALLKNGSTAVTARTTGTEFYSDLEPVLCTNITLTVDSVAFPIASMTLDFAWAVDEVRTVTGASVLQKVLLTRANEGARMNGTMLLVDGAAAFEKALDLYRDGSQVSLVATLSNSTETITLTCGNLQLGNIEASAQGGFMGWNLPFFLNGDWSGLTDNYEFELRYS